MQRYKYLDVARGIGLMLVIISHSSGLSSYLINFYIPLFFVLSGYVYKPGRSYAENVSRKAKRLLIPYFGYSALLFAFYALTGRSAEEMKLSLFGIFYSRFCLYPAAAEENVYLFTIANGAMWYLTAFFVAGLLYHLVVDRCLKSRGFLVGCLVLLAVVTMAFSFLPVLLPWSIDLIGAGVFFMLAGTMLGRAKVFEKRWNVPLILGVLAGYVVLSTVNPGINMSLREYGAYGALSVPLFLAIGIGGSMLCIWLGKLIETLAAGRALAYIGQHTILLLSLHIFGLEMFERIAGRFMDPHALTGAGFAAYHAVRVIVVVCGLLILGKLIDLVKVKIGSRMKKEA